ncbi:MAG: hypothetical protein IH945_05540 [Armatimonadetes bacterium]|nr:hypothetical protein [Armatimonadota bacterium]
MKTWLTLLAASLLLLPVFGCNGEPSEEEQAAQQEQFEQEMEDVANDPASGAADPSAREELERTGEG